MIDLDLNPLTFVIFAVCFVTVLIGAIIYLYPGSARVTTIPGIEPSEPNDGNLADITQAGSLHEFLVNLHCDHGPVASFWMGQQMVVSVASPDLFEEHAHVFDKPADLFEVYKPLLGSASIFFINGGVARKRREIYDACFRQEEMKKLVPSFQKSAEELCTKLSSKASEDHIPLCQYMQALSFKVLLQSVFGDYFKDDKKVVELRRNFDICWSDMEHQVLTGETPEPGSQREKRFNEAKDEVHNTLKDLMSVQRNKPSSGSPSFMTTLSMHGETQAVSDAVTFIAAGFHSTASLLIWVLYFLASHEDYQQKLYKEIKKVIGDKGKIDAENIQKIGYLQQVLNESLRCAVVWPWTARVQDFDTKLAGHTVPKNTPVIHALGVVLQSDEYWAMPNKFDPDRFSPENKAHIKPHAFAAFGFAGRRQCPAFKYANLEVAVMVTVILLKFKLKMVDGQVVTPVYGLVSRPEDEVWITLEKRT